MNPAMEKRKIKKYTKPREPNNRRYIKLEING